MSDGYRDLAEFLARDDSRPSASDVRNVLVVRGCPEPLATHYATAAVKRDVEIRGRE